MPVAHIGALARRFIGQHLIEGGALHLIRGAPAGRMLFAEIECRVAVAAHEGGAVLVLKAGFDHCLQHAGFFDVLHALRQQAFADRETRKLLAFQHDHAAPMAAQQRGGNGARGTRADDNDFTLLNHVQFPCCIPFGPMRPPWCRAKSARRSPCR